MNIEHDFALNHPIPLNLEHQLRANARNLMLLDPASLMPEQRERLRTLLAELNELARPARQQRNHLFTAK